MRVVVLNQCALTAIISVFPVFRDVSPRLRQAFRSAIGQV